MNTNPFHPVPAPAAAPPRRLGAQVAGFLRTADFGLRTSALAVVCWLCAAPATMAFPPAPHHVLFGMVRDEMGDPIQVTNAVVTLETLTGTQLRTRIVPRLDPGINYRLEVPMDAGLTADNYKPTALRPTVAFRMKVTIGQVTYLPIETRLVAANLGRPAQKTRLDLTLGEDSDGDGLPDAWEYMLMDMLGWGLTLTDINPGDDADGDGLTNLQEYLAGTYAFDPEDGFRLDILGHTEGRPVMEFLAIRGRTYTLHGSADMRTWTPVSFRLPVDGASPPSRRSFTATDVRMLRLEAELPEGTAIQMFKMQVQ